MPTNLRVTLPDVSMDQLHERMHQQTRGDLEATASLALIAALSSLPVQGRYTVLEQADLIKLEDILGGGSILNGADLLAKVQRLAGVSFEHIRLQFTPGQLEELGRKAERQGKSVAQLVDQMAPRIHEQFFGLIDQR